MPRDRDLDGRDSRPSAVPLRARRRVRDLRDRGAAAARQRPHRRIRRRDHARDPAPGPAVLLRATRRRTSSRSSSSGSSSCSGRCSPCTACSATGGRPSASSSSRCSSRGRSAVFDGARRHPPRRRDEGVHVVVRPQGGRHDDVLAARALTAHRGRTADLSTSRRSSSSARSSSTGLTDYPRRRMDRAALREAA